MSKKRNMEMQLMMCLSFLLLECLDRLVVTTPKMLKYKADITEFIEEMSLNIADTDAITKTTYFQELQNKILTIVRKQFQDI